MRVSKIVDKARLAAFMQNNAALNAYPLGDLDEPYWPDSEFFALEDNGQILEFALLYSGIKIPILIAIENNSATNLAHLLREIKGNFPDKMYAHISLSQRKALLEDFSASSHGIHHIMELKKHSSLSALASDRVIRLGHQDFEKILALFELGYPGYWFERKMLNYGPYFGIKNQHGEFLCVGGVHLYSETYNVATLGNIVTHPKARGMGLGSQLTARLCQELAQSVRTIGLNVHAENQPAIHIYENLGFEKVLDYEECTLEKRWFLYFFFLAICFLIILSKRCSKRGRQWRRS